MRWDFFYRAENRRLPLPEKEATYELPANITTAQEALEYVWSKFMIPRGSQRSGCYQIQNDLGVWEQVNGKRMDFSTPAKATKVTFKTWKQLEKED